MKTADIETGLRARFGSRALVPVGDLDRPFTSAELREFATHPFVHLGNHTRDHAILTNYRDAEIRDQIDGAQRDIVEMTGIIPRTIAYPNGNESPRIWQASQDAGLHLGIGVRRGRNRLPIGGGSKQARALKRFTLWGGRGWETQCRESRSGFLMRRLFRNAQFTLKAEN
jgi:peptidoglycan/xylan/chitin deacetylase (PgdA/CDA1 family)